MKIEVASFQKTVKNDQIWLWLRRSLERWMIFPGTQNWQTGPKLVSGPDDNQLIKLKSKRRFQSWRLWISYKISIFSKVVAGRPEALLGFFNRINNQFSMNWTYYMGIMARDGQLKLIFDLYHHLVLFLELQWFESFFLTSWASESAHDVNRYKSEPTKLHL